MTLDRAFIPYGVYWSTPFCRWQGSLAPYHSIKLAAETTKSVLAARGVEASAFDGIVLGVTIYQKNAFYGAPWLAGLIGAGTITGPNVAQACATSARALATAAAEVQIGQRDCVLTVCADRTSNGPHIYYPSPQAPGNRGEYEDAVFENFERDPLAKNAMIQTAEKVVKEAGFTREQQDEITLLRYAQYKEALKDDRAFQKRWMAPVVKRAGKKELGTLEADEGIHDTTAEGLAKLRPMMEGGTVTFGSQTHPADGNAGMVLCTRERADAMSRDKNVTVQVLSWGEARTDLGCMPKAVVPAARDALQRAGVDLKDVKAVKTHNPFAVNDLYFCRETGLDPERMNRYGSPLVYGHPQAPTGLRLIIELIEELKDAGGGVGLFSGCAAGDTAMGVVVKVG